MSKLKEEHGSINFDQLRDAVSGNEVFHAEMKNRDSATSKILLGPMFCEEGDDEINFEKLGSLALLYCKFSSSDTPKIFYKIL
jgi:hypothetical protein